MTRETELSNGRSMMAHQLTRMSVLLALCASMGCAAHGNLSLLESQLRQQEDQVHSLNRDLKETREQLQVARGESEKLRGQLVQQAGGKLLPEQSDVIFRASGIKFNAYLTCGVDRDGKPGDEMLSVMLVPTDAQGHTIRLPGTIAVEATDLSAPESQRKLGAWTWPLEAAGKEWHSGFLAEGYHLEVPWQAVPGHSQITVHARLTTPDGRQFDATQVVNVRVAHQENQQPGQPRTAQAKTKSPPTKSPIVQTSRRRIVDEEKPSAEEIRPAKKRVVKEAEEAAETEEAVDPLEERPARVDTSDRFRAEDPPRYQ